MLLNKFKTKKVETILTVGECLRRKREELNISLKDASEKLKIKICYLENLEINNHQELPPDVYVKGFIKGYAQFVGLDSEKMIEMYNRERKIESKIKKKSQKKQICRNKFAAQNFVVVTPKIVTVFFSLLILFTVGYYLWYQVSSFNSTPYLFVSSPAKDQIINDSNIIIEGETEKETTIKINGQSIFVDPDGYFKENIMLQPGENVLIIEAVNKSSKVTKEVRNIIYKKKSESIYIDIKNEEDKDNAASEINLDEEAEYDVEVIGP